MSAIWTIDWTKNWKIKLLGIFKKMLGELNKNQKRMRDKNQDSIFNDVW